MKLKFLLALTFVSLLFQANAASYYWVGGNGNWSDFSAHWAKSSGGSIFHTQVPTAFDDVIFDANSFTGSADGELIIDLSTATCKDMIWNTGSKIVNIISFNNISRTISINGSVSFVANTRFSSNINFLMVATTSANITSNGIDLSNNNITFDSPTGIWNITDSLSVYRLTFTKGQLYAQNKKISTWFFSSYNTNSRTVDIRNGGVLEISSQMNLTTSGLNVLGTGGKLRTIGVVNCDDVISVDTVEVVNSSLSLRNIHAYKISGKGTGLTISTGGQVSLIDATIGIVDLGENPTIDQVKISGVSSLSWTGTFTTQNLSFPGANCSQMPLVSGGVLDIGTSPVSLDYVRIKNVNIAGTTDVTAYNSADLGGNTGITFDNTTARKTYYWIGNSGEWQDPAHWSLTSGGAPAGCIPYENDDVVLDENSFTQPMSYLSFTSIELTCHSFNAENITNNVYMRGNLNVYGSFIFSPLLEYNVDLVTFRSHEQGNIIDFNDGKIYAFTLDGTGEWTVEDSIYTGEIIFKNGTFNLNGNKINCYAMRLDYFYPPEELHLNLDGSEIHIRGGDLILMNTSVDITVDATDSKIYLYDNIFFGSQGVAFNELHIMSNANGGIMGSDNSAEKMFINKNSDIVLRTMSVDSLFLDAGSNIRLGDDATVTVNDIKIIYSASTGCNAYTGIATELTGEFNYSKIYKSSGVLNLNNVALRGIHAEGGATFNAGQSIDQGKNTGWNFTTVSTRTLYWIGDGGDISDPAHWSYTSGGPAAMCAPSPADNIIFNENSFSLASQKITNSNSIFVVQNVLFQNLTSEVELVDMVLEIRGDASFDPMVSSNYTTEIHIKGNGNQYLSGNNAFLNQVIIDIEGTLFMNTDCKGGGLSLNNGNIDFNEKNMDFYGMVFRSYQRKPYYVNMENSIFNVEQITFQDSLRLNAEGSEITIFSNKFSNTTLFESNLLSATDTAMFNIVRLKAADPQSMQGLYFNATNTLFHRIEISAPITVQCRLQDVRSDEMISDANTLNLYINNCTLGYVEFQSTHTNLNELNQVYWKYVKIGPGKTLNIEAGKTLHVIDHLDATGSSNFPITIRSTAGNAQANIKKASGSICFSYLYLSNINATGGASFLAGPTSTNVINNTGWDFTNVCDSITATFVQPWCPGSDLHLIANVPAHVTGFLWTGPGSFTSNAQNPVISGSGNYEGIYTLQAGGQTRKVLAYQSNAAQPNLIVNVNDNSIAHTEAGSTNGINGYTYEWYQDGVLVESGDNGVDYPTEDGNYYVIIKTDDGCSVQSSVVNFQRKVLVTTPSALTVDLNAGNSILHWTDNAESETVYQVERSLNPSSGFLLIATLPADANTYTDFSIPSNTTYYYRIRAINTKLTSDYSEIKSVTNDATTSIADEQEFKLLVYPIPTSDELYLSIPGKQQLSATIEILDLSGKRMINTDIVFNNETFTLSTSSLEEGMYILRIIADGKMKVMRIIKLFS